MNNKYKVGIYLRLSREDENSGESNSIKTQRDLIHKYINDNNLTFIDEYVDDGVSGTTFNRTGFSRMIRDCESKKINMDKFAGAVIISFNTIKEKEEFLSHFQNNFFVHFINVAGKLRYFFCFCCIKKIDNSEFFQKSKIQIEEAPEPEDIIFENLEFTTKTKTYRVVGMNMISLLLIGIGFTIIFGLNTLQNHVNKKKYNKFLYYLISLCITIVSSVINIIFQSLLNFLTKTEKLKSITDYYLSYSVKLALFSFLTSGIIPLICDVISDVENYETLISNMLIMFLVNSIITPLMWTFSPLYYLKKFQIFLIEKNEKPNLYHNLNVKIKIIILLVYYRSDLFLRENELEKDRKTLLSKV